MSMIENLNEVYATCLATYTETKDALLNSERSIDSSSMEIRRLRFLAAAEIRLRGDAESFKRRIKRGVTLKKSILEAYDKGLPVSSSYVTMNGFHWGLDALAAGEGVLTKEFFSLIGGRTKPERQNDLKFISSIAYAVKELVLQGSCTLERLADLKDHVKKPSFVGYGMLIEGISNRDTRKAEEAVQSILKGHKVLIRPGGFFHSTPDEIVCFWALGLINFSASVGMGIKIPEHGGLLPKELLVSG